VHVICDDNAIRYVLPVLPTIGEAKATLIGHHGGKVWCLRLPSY